MIASGQARERDRARAVAEREDREHLPARLLEKMNMSNNSELVHYAFQYQLVERRPRDMGSLPEKSRE
jgi:hypothetical protein